MSDIIADYVYIVGHGHSGTTLLELLLAQHPEIVATGELEKLSLQFSRDNSAPYLGLCSCGMRPHLCPVWTQVADAIIREYGIDIIRHPFRFRISDVGREEDFGIRSFRHWFLRKYSRLLRNYHYSGDLSPLKELTLLPSPHKQWAKNRLFVASTIRQIANATTVIDSSKDPISMMDIYRMHQGKMKVIFITRYVRGNVWSYAKHGIPVGTAAKTWSKVNSRIRNCLCHIASDDWTQLKYEDLCADPINIISQLLTFFGYDHVESMRQAHHKYWHTIGGNKIRHSVLNSIVEDVSWQQHLSAEDLELINHIAGREARLLGY